MYEERFTKWFNWRERNIAEGINDPGIYVCAVSERNISGRPFSWLPQVVYIGMTNSIGGLKARLQQFDNTIGGKQGHGGADRVRFEHQDYQILVEHLYVAVASFKCNVKSNMPANLRLMGEVAKFEYDCFANFVEQYNTLPKFNDKKKSPKYSKILR